MLLSLEEWVYGVVEVWRYGDMQYHGVGYLVK